MGTLNFEIDKRILNHIKSALKRRGLLMDPENEWEIHGPHEDMNYQVCIGIAYERLDYKIPCTCEQNNCLRHRDGFYVVIYPRAVYCIEDPDDWWKPKEEDKIPSVH